MANTINPAGEFAPTSVDALAPSPTPSASRSGVARAGSAHPTVASVDSASLTPLGNLASAAGRAASSMPNVRPAVVAHLQAQISAGTYQPDPTAVAARVATALARTVKP